MPKINTRSNKFFLDTRSGKYYVNKSASDGASFTPTAVLLTSGTSYTVPAGATSMKAWAIGSGGNDDKGAGGTAYKTWTVNGGDSVSYSVGAAVVNTGYGDALGNNTTLTYGGTTITGFGGGRRANGTTGVGGGGFSGGDGGANGGAGVYQGGGDYAAGAVGGNTLITDLPPSANKTHQATDVSGLFSVLTLLGVNYTIVRGGPNVNVFGSGTRYNKYGDVKSSGGIGGGNGYSTPTEQRETGAVLLYFT